MKKIALLMFSLVSCYFVFPLNAYASGAVLNVSGGGDHKLKTTFNVNISLNTGGEKVCVVGFDMTYPSNIVTLSGTPTFSSDSIMSVEKDVSTPGKLHYLLGMTGCPSTNSTLVTAKFTSAKIGSGSFGFSSIEAFGGADGEASVSITGSAAAVSVSAATTTKTTVVATPAPTTPEPVEPVVASLPVNPPVATKIEFSPSATLDSTEKKTKGIILSGTSDPDATVSYVSGDSEIGPNAVFVVSGGTWTLNLDTWISDGLHTFTIVSEKGGVKSAEATIDFVTGSGGRSQIALGKVLPALDCNLDNSCVKAKEGVFGTNISLNMILIIAGSFVVLLVITLLVVFGLKRKRYLSFANDFSSSMRKDKNFFSGNSDVKNVASAAGTIPTSLSVERGDVSNEVEIPKDQESFRLPAQESIEITDSEPETSINAVPQPDPQPVSGLSQDPSQPVPQPQTVAPSVQSVQSQANTRFDANGFWGNNDPDGTKSTVSSGADGAKIFYEDPSQEGFCRMQNFKPEHQSEFGLNSQVLDGPIAQVGADFSKPQSSMPDTGSAPSYFESKAEENVIPKPFVAASQTSAISGQNDMMESIAINMEPEAVDHSATNNTKTDTQITQPFTALMDHDSSKDIAGSSFQQEVPVFDPYFTIDE